MPELAGQIQTGRPLSEIECFQGAIEGLREAADHMTSMSRGAPSLFGSRRQSARAATSVRKARDCLRGMSLLRGDLRWQIIVRQLDKLADNMDDGSARLSHAPGAAAVMASALQGMVYAATKLKDRAGPSLLILPHLEPRR